MHECKDQPLYDQNNEQLQMYISFNVQYLYSKVQFYSEAIDSLKDTV